MFGLYRFCALLLIASSTATVLATDEPRRTFEKGIYRQDGKCTTLMRDGQDFSSNCKPFVGVSVRDFDRPRFMFSQGSGHSWFFIAVSGAEYSNENRIARYQVSGIYDSSVQMGFLYEGECVVTIARASEEIRCMAWKEPERTTLVWEAVFVGNGMWFHQPSF